VISAVIMIVGSLFGKWMAVLIMIPEPVIGGVFLVLCGKLLHATMLNCCVLLSTWVAGIMQISYTKLTIVKNAIVDVNKCFFLSSLHYCIANTSVLYVSSVGH